jgi:hypothetical protein
MRSIQNLILSGVFAAVIAASAPAQDPEGPPPPVPVEAQDSAGGRAEMIELFHAVESRLREIDELLFDASAGESALGKIEESGIEELLSRSTAKAEEAVSGIDRILEIARQYGGT